MNTTIKALLLATALTFFGPVVAHADQAACLITQNDFLDKAINETKAEIYVASDKARDVIIGAINDARANAGNEPFLVDTLMVGVFSKGNEVFIGTVMFKDGCVVVGSVHAFYPNDWEAFLAQVGLSIKDFSKLRGA